MNLNIKTLAVLTSFALASACTQSTQSGQPSPAPAPPTRAVEEGGVNGGGGGTLPANPISVYEVHEIVREAKKTLGPLIMMQLRQFDQSETGYEQKLFGSSPNLFDILYSTNIEIPDDKACKDANGNDVDGSVHATAPNAICISAYRIAPKLIKERAPIEILALIYHELGHKLGLTEPEAVYAQKMTAINLGDDIRHDNIDDVLAKSDSTLGAVSDALWKIDLPRMDERHVAEYLKEANQLESSISFASYPFEILTKEESELERLYGERLQVLWWSTIKNSDRSAKYQLDRVFLGQATVTYGAYKARIGYPAGSTLFDQQVIENPKDLTSLKPILQEISLFYSALAQRPKAFLYGTQPNPLFLPTEQNHFGAFAGTYEVKTVSCDDAKTSPDEIKFEIKPNGTDGNRLHLFSSGRNHWGDDGGLYSGASVFNASSGVRAESGSNWASRSQEFGDRWGSRQGWNFRKRTIKFVNSNGAYSMIRTDEWTNEKYNPSSFDVGKVECVFQLQRTN